MFKCLSELPPVSPSRTSHSFAILQVVDSKRGPGPKHMKEITKRARRREARAAASSSGASTSPSSSIFATPSLSSINCFASTPSCSVGSMGFCWPKHSGSYCVACWADAYDPINQCNSNNSNSTRLEGATRTRAAAARQLEAASECIFFSPSDCPASSPSSTTWFFIRGCFNIIK